MKTKLSVSIAAAAVAALALVGCSAAGPAASPSADATSSNALEGVEWSEDENGVPTLTFEAPYTFTENGARIVQDGDGEALELGQNIALDYTISNTEDGTVSYSTYDEGGASEIVPFSEDMMDPVLIEALTGAHVGADFIYGVVQTSTDDAGATTTSTVLMAVTVSGVVPAKAEGTAVEPVEGLPVVTLDETGKPSVEIPETDPPAELVAQPTIKGDGEVVEEGDSLTVHYTGWLWDGTQFDSSWDRGYPSSFTLAEGSLIDGWVQGLAGQTVGSQVLLVIPSDLGYGEEGNDSIPGGSTLVFVVDILAAS